MPSTGTPESKTLCGARGDPSSVTEHGPPERITALGRISAKARSACLERRDFAIDARLAHAPRDQLRHLRAEIDDQHLVMAIGDVVMEGVGRGGHGFSFCRPPPCPSPLKQPTSDGRGTLTTQSARFVGGTRSPNSLSREAGEGWGGGIFLDA